MKLVENIHTRELPSDRSETKYLIMRIGAAGAGRTAVDFLINS